MPVGVPFLTNGGLIVNYNTNKKEVIAFRKVIPAGQTMILKERVKDNGTIEGIRVRFYSGQQLALRVNPYIEHKGQKIENLLTYSEGSNPWLAGDDDPFEYPCVVTVEYDDYVKVWVQNTDAANDYDLVLDVIIDYYNGQNRVV